MGPHQSEFQAHPSPDFFQTQNDSETSSKYMISKQTTLIFQVRCHVGWLHVKAAGTSNAHDEGACYKLLLSNSLPCLKSLGPYLKMFGFRKHLLHMQVNGYIHHPQCETSSFHVCGWMGPAPAVAVVDLVDGILVNVTYRSENTFVS